MINFKLNKKSTYLLACTFNSDSMCLLDMLLKENVKPILCTIKYTESQQNPLISEKLRGYCKENGLVIEEIDADVEKSCTNNINKRDFARKIRYQFFKKVYEKYDASGLFVAHNQDDVLEAYLLRDKKDKKAKTYGWNSVSEQDGMIVIRPLLNYSEQDIINYNEENKVPFQILSDSNRELIENPIRRNVIDKLSEIEREQLLREMKEETSDKAEFLEGIRTRIDTGGELEVREILALNANEFAESISNFISTFEEDIKVDSTLLSKIRKMCLSPNENENIQLSETLWITKEYDVLTIGGNLAKPVYSYNLNKPGKLKTEYFEMDFSNGAADRGFRLSDYPLTIRPAVPEDLFNVHGFMTPVRKLYYDWRMPPKKKVIWPVIAKKYGEIIYIPRYHRLHRTDHSSVFEIKFSEDN